MLKQGSDSISLKSPFFFLVKQGFICLMATKFGRVLKHMNSQLLMKENFQIFLKSGTEHAPKNLIFIKMTTDAVYGLKEQRGLAPLLW